MNSVSGDIRQYYELSGSGEPIVFIHGSFASHASWKKIVEQLSQTHMCISIKLPGHGGMQDPSDFESPSLAPELEVVQKVLLDITGDEQTEVHLVGHSYGAVVALALAVNNSLNTKTLSLFEPVAGNVFKMVGDEVSMQIIESFLQDYKADIEANEGDAAHWVIDFWGGKGAFASLPENAKNAMRGLVPNNLRHWDICLSEQYSISDFHQYIKPCAVICGSNSNSIAHKIADIIVSQQPKAKKYQIEGASHFMVSTHVEASLDILRKQLL